MSHRLPHPTVDHIIACPALPTILPVRYLASAVFVDLCAYKLYPQNRSSSIGWTIHAKSADTDTYPVVCQPGKSASMFANSPSRQKLRTRTTWPTRTVSPSCPAKQHSPNFYGHRLLGNVCRLFAHKRTSRRQVKTHPTATATVADVCTAKTTRRPPRTAWRKIGRMHHLSQQRPR